MLFKFAQLIGFSSHSGGKIHMFILSCRKVLEERCLFNLIVYRVQYVVHHWSRFAEIWQMAPLVSAFNDCQNRADRPEEMVKMLNGLQMILQTQSFVVYDMFTKHTSALSPERQLTASSEDEKRSVTHAPFLFTHGFTMGMLMFSRCLLAIN